MIRLNVKLILFEFQEPRALKREIVIPDWPCFAARARACESAGLKFRVPRTLEKISRAEIDENQSNSRYSAGQLIYGAPGRKSL